MTLTIAEVERWDGGDVREVFYAAASRTQAAQDAADGIATLPAFTTWGGKAAEAAKEAIAATGQQLNAHSAEVRAVANAARTAADEIDRIKSELATLKSDAAALDMEIDPATNQVIEGSGFKGTPMESLLKRQQLQRRVDKLVAEANFIDFALAGAINRADGTTPAASTPDSAATPVPPGPPVQAVREPPAEPAEPGSPATWQEMLVPNGAAKAGAPTAAPTLEELLSPPGNGTAAGEMPANLDAAMYPPGMPLPGPPPSLLDRANAARLKEGRPPLNPRSDPEFMARARDLLAQQGIPADQIDQRLSSLIDMMDRPVADVVAPERQRQPAPGFEEGFRESWFANEEFVKGLMGQAGPGAPGILESWKNLASGIGETLADPMGAVKDEIDRALNAPSLAHYAGGWTADLTQSAALGGPLLGPEMLAGKAAMRALDFDYDTTPGLAQELNHAHVHALSTENRLFRFHSALIRSCSWPEWMRDRRM